MCAGSIPGDLASILQRMELDTDHWVQGVKRYGSLYYRVAGRADRLAKAARKVGPSDGANHPLAPVQSGRQYPPVGASGACADSLGLPLSGAFCPGALATAPRTAADRADLKI